MSEEELVQQVNELKVKLNKTLRQVAGLKEKSKILESEYKNATTREESMNELTMQLMERQRELNVMLNRANIMLNRTQEAMALTSIEFNEMAKALPEPKKAEWSDRVTKINDLFKKTGIPDAELKPSDQSTTEPEESVSAVGIEERLSETLDKKELLWRRKESGEKPPKVEAQLLDEEPSNVSAATDNEGGADDNVENEVTDAQDSQEEASRRKSWWQRIAGSSA